jgi:hypothetical protein
MEDYSFDEILKSNLSEITGKQFVRKDNGEHLGVIYAKYPTDCGNRFAELNYGILEFLLKTDKNIENVNSNKITVLLGAEIETNNKIFSMIK